MNPKLFGALICLLLMSACTFHNPAPIVDHSDGRAGSSQSPSGTYRVRAGDTLFGVAFSYGLDQRELAAWNNISEPYTIYPEQLLRLSATTASSAPSDRAADSGGVKIYTATTPQSTNTRTYTTRDVPPASAGQKPVPPAEATQKPVPPAGANQKPVPPAPSSQVSVPSMNTTQQKAVPPSAPPASAASEPQAQVSNTQKPVPAAPIAVDPPAASTAKPIARTTAPPAAKPAATQSHANPSAWLWPTSGRVLRGFVAGDPARNGVDIAGNEGQPIQATAAGTVVYSGDGLIGYGELIIIKHSDNMLSAYAHNKVRLVNEGQQVAAGEKIAEMGRNDRNEQLLHFEIRTLGKPVNPLIYLPKQ